MFVFTWTVIAQPDTKHEMHSIKVLFPKQCQSFWMHLNKYDNISNFSIMQKCPPPLFSILKDHPIKKYTTLNKYILQMVRNSHSHTDMKASEFLQMFGAIIKPVIRIHTYITIKHTYINYFDNFIIQVEQ